MYLSRFLIALLFPLTMVIAFQNCSTSSFEQPDISLSDTEDSNDTNGGDDSSAVLQGPDGLVSLNLNDGDSVTFLKSGNIFPAAQERVVMAKANGRILMTSESQKGVADPNTSPKLPQFYCDKSTLPHCRHLSQLQCKSTHCDASSVPVVCSEDFHISGEGLAKMFGLLSGIKTKEKRLQAGEAQIADCDSPTVAFAKVGEDPVTVSLAQRSCVQEGRLYAYENHEGLIDDMNGRLQALGARPDSCNNFFRYRWKNTSFEYTSQSGGNEPANLSFVHQVIYKGDQRADIRYKNPGDATILCANDLLLNDIEIGAFFPEGGIRYDVLKILSASPDSATAQVKYKDPAYGIDGEAKFFLNEMTAKAFSGGAIVDKVHEDAMTAAVAQLFKRANDRGLTTPCQ